MYTQISELPPRILPLRSEAPSASQILYCEKGVAGCMRTKVSRAPPQIFSLEAEAPLSSNQGLDCGE